MTGPVADELIDPPTVEDLSQEDLERLLEGVRERRAAVARVLSRAAHRARETKVPDLAIALEKKLGRLRKALERLDGLLGRCEALANEVVALRLQHRDLTAAGLVAEMRGE